MPSDRTKWLLDQLKVEFERGAYRKNIKIETLIRKLKKEGLSEREDQIWRLHIAPVFRNLSLKEGIERSKSFAEEVAASKVKSTAKKEIDFLVKLLKSGDPSYEKPKVKYLKPGKKFQTWMILEMDEILAVIADRVYEPYKIPCLIALYSSLWRSAIVPLKKKDKVLKPGMVKREVNIKRREIRVIRGKTGKEIFIPMSGKLCEAFQSLPVWPLRDDDPFFPSLNGSALTASVSRAFTRAGYEWFTFHNLRHTAACYLLEQGVDITIICELLGHSSIKVTMDFYARVKPEALKKAVGKWDV